MVVWHRRVDVVLDIGSLPSIRQRLADGYLVTVEGGVDESDLRSLEEFSDKLGINATLLCSYCELSDEDLDIV
jgi:3-keto-L-gulonate-6-phosphate decarboxylase